MHDSRENTNFTHITHIYVDTNHGIVNYFLSISGGNVYNGNVMKIHSVSKEDRGTYYCFADNDVGKGDRRNVNLEVDLMQFTKINIDLKN